MPTVADATDAAYNTGRLLGARVLLIEDNEINRTVARMMLEPWGVELEEAEDGASGLAQLMKSDFDLVLTDIQMPGLSGIDVTERVRQLPDPRRAATPIIALTANAFRADVERYLAAGVNACLTKPYDEATLYQTMEALLPALPPAAPAYNLAPLREMAKGREAFVHKIVRSFLSNMPRSLAQLKQVLHRRLGQRKGRLAHHIKPNLHTLGICDVGPALEMLVRLHSDEPAAAPEAPAVLRQALAQLVAGVERALAGLCAELTE